MGERLQEREGRRRKGTGRTSWCQATNSSGTSSSPGDISPVRRVQLQEHHLLRRLLADHEGKHQAGTEVQAVQDECSLGVPG